MLKYTWAIRAVVKISKNKNYAPNYSSYSGN